MNGADFPRVPVAAVNSSRAEFLAEANIVLDVWTWEGNWQALAVSHRSVSRDQYFVNIGIHR